MEIFKATENEIVTIYQCGNVWLAKYPDRYILDYDDDHFLVFVADDISSEWEIVNMVRNGNIDDELLLKAIIDLCNGRMLSSADLYIYICILSSIREHAVKENNFIGRRVVRGTTYIYLK